MPDAFSPARAARLAKYRARALEASRRVARGEGWAEVAESYGIADVKAFRRRVRAHVGEVDRCAAFLELLDEVDAAVDECHVSLRRKLAEIRRRYE